MLDEGENVAYEKRTKEPPTASHAFPKALRPIVSAGDAAADEPPEATATLAEIKGAPLSRISPNATKQYPVTFFTVCDSTSVLSDLLPNRIPSFTNLPSGSI